MHGLRGTLERVDVGGVVVDSVFDGWDHITSTTVAGTTRSFVTGPNEQLIRQTDGSGGSETYVYGYGGQRPLAAFASSGEMLGQYVYGQRGHVPEYMVTNTGATWVVVADLRGSPRFLVDAATGAIIETYEYSPFGVLEVGVDSTVAMPFRFAGGIREFGSQRLRIGVRTYDPELGRWLSRDRLVHRGAGPNAYVYANNDPVNTVDTDGRIAPAIPAAAKAVWAALVAGAGVIARSPLFRSAVKKIGDVVLGDLFADTSEELISLKSMVLQTKKLIQDTCDEAEATEEGGEVTDWTVDGTPVTEHGAKAMDDRDFTDEDVDRILGADPDGIWQEDRQTYKHTDGNGNYVITRPGDGGVVTIYSDGPFGIK